MHENAGNIGLRMEMFRNYIERLNVNVLSMAYRGYSESDGTPNEAGLKKDADAIIEFLKKPPAAYREMFDPDLLFLQGRSLGGAVAIYMGHRSPEAFKGLIIENTFTSISDMAEKILIVLKYVPKQLKRLLVRIGWDSDQLVPEITLPILYVTGDKDEVVPFQQTLILYKKSTKSINSEIYLVPGGRHMNS